MEVKDAEFREKKILPTDLDDGTRKCINFRGNSRK